MAALDGRNVINLLECPSCHQTMAPPIFLCKGGHNVCSGCTGQMSNCPSCNKPVTKERNHPAERLAEKLPYSCANLNLGCKEKFLLHDLPSHEAACPKRLYYCVPCRPRCRWRGRRFQDPHLNYQRRWSRDNVLPSRSEDRGFDSRPWSMEFFQVLEHMKDEHKELVWVKAYNSLVYENFNHETDYACTHILSSYREIFWCHSKRDAKQGKLFEVVQYIGRKDKATKFEYEFEFYSKGNNRTAVFRNKVRSEDDDVEKVYASGDCLVLDLSVLKYFITEKQQLFYNFKIERVQ